MAADRDRASLGRGADRGKVGSLEGHLDADPLGPARGERNDVQELSEHPDPHPRLHSEEGVAQAHGGRTGYREETLIDRRSERGRSGVEEDQDVPGLVKVVLVRERPSGAGGGAPVDLAGRVVRPCGTDPVELAALSDPSGVGLARKGGSALEADGPDPEELGRVSGNNEGRGRGERLPLHEADRVPPQDRRDSDLGDRGLGSGPVRSEPDLRARVVESSRVPDQAGGPLDLNDEVTSVYPRFRHDRASEPDVGRRALEREVDPDRWGAPRTRDAGRDGREEEGKREEERGRVAGEDRDEQQRGSGRQEKGGERPPSEGSQRRTAHVCLSRSFTRASRYSRNCSGFSAWIRASSSIVVPDRLTLPPDRSRLSSNRTRAGRPYAPAWSEERTRAGSADRVGIGRPGGQRVRAATSTSRSAAAVTATAAAGRAADVFVPAATANPLATRATTQRNTVVAVFIRGRSVGRGRRESHGPLPGPACSPRVPSGGPSTGPPRRDE